MSVSRLLCGKFCFRCVAGEIGVNIGDVLCGRRNELMIRMRKLNLFLLCARRKRERTLRRDGKRMR